MFWKFGDEVLLNHASPYLYGTAPGKCVKTFPGERVVYLGKPKYSLMGYVDVVMKEVFDAASPHLTKKNTSTQKKRLAHFKGHVNRLPMHWVRTPELKEKGFEVLL